MGTEKTFQRIAWVGLRPWPGVAVEASSILSGIETGVPIQLRDEPGGNPIYWPGGARRRGGVSSVCGSCTEHEKASADTAAGSTGLVGPPGRKRESAEAGPEGTEYRYGARRRTGL